MKVLLDIHALGRGMLDRKSQRGIYRYVQNVTSSMARRKEIDLSLCSSDKWQFVGSCYDYLNETTGLKGIPFIHHISPFDRAVIRLFKTSDYAVKFEKSGPKKIFLKAFLREPSRAVMKFRQILSGNILSTADLADTEIYFSPNFVAMPEVIRTAPWVKNFVTVHDIMPVLTPQYFKERR